MRSTAADPQVLRPASMGTPGDRETPKRMRVARLIRAAAVLFATGALMACATTPAVRGAAQGRAAAERAIAEGRPCILEIGLLDMSSGILDPRTGLPRDTAGCIAGDETVAFVEAHNDTVLAALRSGRLKGVTYEDQLTSKDAVAARFESEGGVALLAAGEPATSPGDRFRVEVALRDRSGSTVPYLFVSDTSTGERRELDPVGESGVRVLFEHGGRTLLVRDDGSRVYRTFDLARAMCLQVFPQDRNRR